MEARQNSKSSAGKGRSSTASGPHLQLRTVDRAVGQVVDSKRELGRYLAEHRESVHMTLDQIARTTKIPRTSLAHLEAGRFDALPGDVFVRGFLRSYACCVHLDGDDVVRRYAQCGLMPAPVSGELADSFLAHKRRNIATGTQAPPMHTNSHRDADLKSDLKTDAEPDANGEAGRNVLRDAFDLSKQHLARRVAVSQAKAARSKAEASEAAERRAEARKAEADAAAQLPERSRTFIPPSFNFDEEMSRRGPLTLGVIILVIVATLTMSYLLRRPGTSTDGFTMNEQPALETTQVLAIADDLVPGSAASI